MLGRGAVSLCYRHEMRGFFRDVIANAINLLGKGVAEAVAEEGAADREEGRGGLNDAVEALVAVDTAGNADGRVDPRNKLTAERVGIAAIAVTEKVEAVDSLFQGILCLGEHFIKRALKDRGTSADLSDKGHIFELMLYAEVADRIVVFRAEKDIAVAPGGKLGAAQTVLFGVGDDLQNASFSTALKGSKQLLHLALGQTLFLKSPHRGGGVFASIEQRGSVGDGEIMFCQHYDQLGRFHRKNPPLPSKVNDVHR